MEGDLELGRKTLPIVLGYKSRILMAAALGCYALGTPLLLLLTSSALAIGVVSVVSAFHIWLAARILQDKGAAEEDLTYKLMYVLSCIVWGSAALWLKSPVP